MNLEIIRFDDVSVHYGRVCALENICAEVHCGSMTAVVGPNGAGKSTLLRATLGWHGLSSGRILIGDDHIQHHHPRLSYVPQKIHVDWDFPTTVRAVAEQGRFASIGGFRGFGAEDHQFVDSALREMGLTELAGRQIGELSGGQQQRVFLARAIAQGGDIFLLDEPFEGVDASVIRHLVELFQSWKHQHRTIFAAVHDLRLAREAFSHALLLSRRLVAFGRVEDVLTAENIRQAYGEDVPLSAETFLG
ncbi:MAG: manganese/iron transport system ATP-binding protein [Candidatus Sumerlaeota bacterium]|nr:manganese/iron transport system ATP-binding protein [Candidatus Sumerlaeota bacterium]